MAYFVFFISEVLAFFITFHIIKILIDRYYLEIVNLGRLNEVEDLLRIYKDVSCFRNTKNCLYLEFYKKYIEYRTSNTNVDDEFFIDRLNDWLELNRNEGFFAYLAVIISVAALADDLFIEEIKILHFITTKQIKSHSVGLLILLIIVIVLYYMYTRSKISKVLRIKSIIVHYQKNGFS